ncbi:MAG: phenylalanine--tRNA ligase subunit beta, partial [Pseudomonadota bacterium]
DKLLIGEVLEVKPHPNADKLKVCTVDVGRKRSLKIVCGASNAAPGIRVPVALPGCRLGDLKIKKSDIRGEISSGMLCSQQELGLADQSSGLMILDDDAPVGAVVHQYLNLSDPIIEVDLTPNRGDCLSIHGVAREVSALTSARLSIAPAAKVKNSCRQRLDVTLKAPEACPRYVGRAVCNIDMQANSPDWLVERLRRSGLRSINPVVDITNYVMLETGQPMHAFDLDKINGGIVVRMARERESLKLLDGSTVRMNPNNLVIADHKGAIALAGIMGGDSSAISDRTTNIYFESAFFSADAIAGKAREFGMHTDASHRFERGVDSKGQVNALERATALLQAIAGGDAGPVTHALERKQLPVNRSIHLVRSEIPRLLGASFPAAKINALLRRLGMHVKSAAGGWRVTAPSWRFDISGSHDLVEEVGRCLGFDQIEPRMPVATGKTGSHPERSVSTTALKSKLVAEGFYEAITYSFVDASVQQALLESKKPVKLSNPIADNMSVMRQSLWPGLLEAMVSNVNRQNERVRLFEVGHVFSAQKPPKSDDRIQLKHRETNVVAGVLTGSAQPRHWQSQPRATDFFDMKGIVERLMSHISDTVTFGPASHPALHPGQTAEIRLDAKSIGYLGQLHPEKQAVLGLSVPIYAFEIQASPLLERPLPAFSTISKFPPVQRDLAVLVDRSVAAQDVLNTVKEAAGDMLIDLQLFDIYEGERIEKNQKSFAFSLTLQSESSNLTTSDAEQITDKILTALKQSHGGHLRPSG